MSVLKISEQKSIGDFQKEFNSIFPFLKIEFYKMKPSLPSEESKEMLLLSEYQPLGKNLVIIDIDNTTTVANLKALLQKELDLISMIYRKSGKMWIETSLTEDWTLERQNYEAELMNNSSI